MGYPYSQKGYKLLDMKTQQFFASWDVMFHEICFAFAVTNANGPIFPPKQF